MGDGTGTRRHAANGDQGLDTHSGAADLDSGAEDVGDGQVCIMQRGEPHAEDATSQRTQLPEGATTAKSIKSEEAGGTKDGDKGGGDLDAEDAEGQQTQLPEDTATVQEIKIGDAGSEQVGVTEGNDLDAGDSEGRQGGVTDDGDLDAEDAEGQWTQLPEVAAATGKIKIEDAGGEQVGVKDGSDLDAKDAKSQVSKPSEVTAMAEEVKIEDVGDEQVCIKEGGGLYAEDVEGQLAMLPEVATTTEDIKIEDIQVGNPGEISPEEIDKLRKIIWRRRHLLIGKENALPPAARGAICDIDVGNAKPVAQRVRKVAPQFREKLSQLLKGLQSAKIIQISTSPWASPIVVIIKKNGVDIRLCIDYRLINSLTRLMVYPMPLINDLLDDLDKVLWYCSLDMASGFWVVSMTEKKISYAEA
ncbi:hypothetical protein PR003_g30169 [Phytophthora rubi]|uniref:Reverse transcriptase domain-containing protein n=2 Tax=Phytophthora rubi TaxID=129364 RepID=A0A6A3H5R3_9STRA|nr:hypothetical protein PR001_g28932 [Phytophthora rubi]KAE9272554.1 hypothetical protein PR003_g30169 [Phytophthora rubi]